MKTLDQLAVDYAGKKIGFNFVNRFAKLYGGSCFICNLPPIYNKKPIKNQLDHIDGNKFNHEFDNLRLICPNCHSQTKTHSNKRDLGVSDDELRTIVCQSESWYEAGRKLNLTRNSVTIVRNKAQSLGVKPKLSDNPFKLTDYHFNYILVKNGKKLQARTVLRLREYFGNKCSSCYIETWNGKPITFQIDHINGINTDNRIENLRLLCPNCHSQTDSFCRAHKHRKQIDR